MYGMNLTDLVFAVDMSFQTLVVTRDGKEQLRQKAKFLQVFL